MPNREDTPVKIRRICSLFIAAALIFSLLPLGAIATDEEDFSGPAPVLAADDGQNGGEESAQPEETTEIPEGEPEEEGALPSDVIGTPGEEQGGQQEGPGSNESEGGEAGQPGSGDEAGAGGETGEPAEGEPAEGGQGEPEEGEPAEGEEGEIEEGNTEEGEEGEPAEGEEGEEGAEGEEPAEPVDVTALFGEELADYIEDLLAKEDYESIIALLGALSEEQIQSLVEIGRPGLILDELASHRDGHQEEEAFDELFPASEIPIGPVIRGNSGSSGAAGGLMAGPAAFGKGLMMMTESSPSLPGFVAPPDGLTVTKTATVQGSLSNGRQFFQLDLSASSQSDIVTERVPADITLVLDVSGSMSDRVTTYTYTPINSGYNTNATYYIDLDPGPGTNWQAVTHWAHIFGPNHWATSHKLFGDGCDVVYPTPGGTGENGQYQFYTRTSSSFVKLTALKTAVNNFLASVLANSPDSRVAIVTYADDSLIRTGGVSNALLPVKGSNGGLNGNLTSVVNGLGANGATRSDLGFANAAKIFQAYNQPETEERNRVVIHFTDGEPTTYNTFSNQVAADAIRWAKVLKNARGASTDVSDNLRFPATGLGSSTGTATIDNTTGCGATVYTIGIFPANVDSRVHEYMWRCSSESPESAPKSDSNPDYTPNAPGNMGYYLTADSADSLNDIFQGISREMGKSFKNVAVRDYISSNFELCDENGQAIDVSSTDAYKIGRDDYGLYVEWENVSIEPGKTPFTGTIYVRPKDDFIGGNNVPTNIEGISAIYNGSTIVASFPVPKVNVPIVLGSGEREDYIYLGDSITETMVNTAEADLLNDILGGPNRGMGNTLITAWDHNPSGEKPEIAKDHTYTLNVKVTPEEAESTSVGTEAEATEAEGTYTVHVRGATLQPYSCTILLGRTADLKSELSSRLEWNQISGRTPPTDGITYTLDGAEFENPKPESKDTHTYKVKAYRNNIELASAAFTVEVVAPEFGDRTYNVLLGMNLGQAKPDSFTEPGIGIDYGSITMQYDEGEIEYEPRLSANYVPTGDETVTVTVKYKDSNIVIGSADVTIKVYHATFTGKTFNLLKGEPALNDGYTAARDGIDLDNIEYPQEANELGLAYPVKNLICERDITKGGVDPEDPVTIDTTNYINVYYGNAESGTLLTQQPVSVQFNVFNPTFEDRTFVLFYGETVKAAHPAVTLNNVIEAQKPVGWTNDTRWEAYVEHLTGVTEEGYENALETVFEPGSPDDDYVADRFTMTIKYGDTVVTDDSDLPEVVIKVVPCTLTINVSASANGYGSIDGDQTFLFQITGPGNEVFYEYITLDGKTQASRTITGLKKGTYKVTELNSWSWRFSPTSAQDVKLGDRTGELDLDGALEKASGKADFAEQKVNDDWLGDEAAPKPLDFPPRAQGVTAAAILPGKENGMPESGPAQA